MTKQCNLAEALLYNAHGTNGHPGSGALNYILKSGTEQQIKLIKHVKLIPIGANHLLIKSITSSIMLGTQK